MSLKRKIIQKNYNRKHNTTDFNESDELKQLVEGASEDIPMKDGSDFDPLEGIIPRSNFAYKHLYDSGEIELNKKYERDS